MSIEIYYMLYELYDMKQKKEEMASVYRWRKLNKYVENKTGILYNNIVDQLKGM